MIGADDVLAFWFADGPSVQRKLWFEKNADFDTACGDFADALAAAKRGELDQWADTPRGALALIILLDQFSRNLLRGSPETFAADAQARGLRGAPWRVDSIASSGRWSGSSCTCRSSILKMWRTRTSRSGCSPRCMESLAATRWTTRCAIAT